MALKTLTATPTTAVNTTPSRLASGKIAGNSGTYTLQVNVAKTSGTVAGTIQPQTSIDGTNWFNTPGASAFTLTDVANQSQAWFIENKKGLYYGALVTGQGTMVATPTGVVLLDEDDA
jgi:hypothetical protein